MINPRKAAIIGLGNVGASIAFAFMQDKLFSELVLIDYNNDKAQGEAMDLSDGVPHISSINIHAGNYEDLSDASLVVITAGSPRKPGETRIDLVEKNAAILKSIIDEIKKTEFSGILLIVSNPVDILTHIAQKLSGYPEHKVFGSGTVLDSARLQNEIARRFRMDPRDVHTMIVGEHGDSEVPLWSKTSISGINLTEYCHLRGHEQCELSDSIFESVKASGHEIIKKKGATYYGIAMAVTKIAAAIVKDEHSILPVSVALHGEFGLDDVHLSLPSIVGAKGINQVLQINLSDDELEKLRTSGKALRSILDKTGY